MKDDPKARAFEICLERMQVGASLEQVLALYPQWADELRPLLQTAQAARSYGAAIQVPKSAQMRSRTAFLEAAHPRAQHKPGLFFRSLFWKRGLVTLSLVLILLVGAARTVVVSAQALPGDALYPIKIVTEQARLLLTDNPVHRMELERSYNLERLEEIEALIQRSNSTNKSYGGEVRFSGGLTQMGSDEWLVGGVHIKIDRNTKITGKIAPGLYVDIQGILQPGGAVLAQQAKVQEYDITGNFSAGPSGTWLVGGVAVSMAPETVIQGLPIPGILLHVTAVQLLDGSLQARLVRVLSPTTNPIIASATQTHTVENTSQPTQNLYLSPTPKPREQVEPEKTPEPVETERPEDTPEPTEVEGHTETPEPTEVKQPQETPKPTEIDEHQQTPQPTDQEEHERTPEPTDQEEHTPETSPTPWPTEHDD